MIGRDRRSFYRPPAGTEFREELLNEIRAKNTLLRREQELSYEAETKVEFYPDKNGEQAGLTCYYSTATYARCAVCYEEGRKIQLVIHPAYRAKCAARPLPLMDVRRDVRSSG